MRIIPRYFRRQAAGSNPPGPPEGLRLYVIGDIHGRFDLLTILYAELARDMERAVPQQAAEIFLGDYVDRGPQSREVVNWLIQSEPVTSERICLMGNHEAMMLQSLDRPEALRGWRDVGGLETLHSYGVSPPIAMSARDQKSVHQSFRAALPAEHGAFLRSLPARAEFGDYFFVHAGVSPARDLASQRTQDLLWTREPFLSSTADFGKIVVHGHTPVKRPDVRPNRINIDTGAYMTGRLTCLVLEGEARRFLQTGLDPDR